MNVVGEIINKTKRLDLETIQIMSVYIVKILKDIDLTGWDRHTVGNVLMIMHNKFDLDLERMAEDLKDDNYGSVLHDFGMATKCIDTNSFEWKSDGGVPRYAK
jgi:hypothetical protein